jgi:hypothetical protein
MTTSLAPFAIALSIAACTPSAGGNMTGGKELGMMNCPSAVEGAVTRLEATPRGVDLTITAVDPSAREELVTLTKVHAAMRGPNLEKPIHHGQHGGPGTVGHCPVIHVGTEVTYEEVAGGVRIHVVAQDPDDTLHVQQLASERAAALRDDEVPLGRR